jgi:hypothetical protein
MMRIKIGGLKLNCIIIILRSLNLLVITILMAACSKSNTASTPSNNVFKGSYYKMGIKAKANIKVFSNSGEIKDVGVLTRFEARDSLFLNFFARTIGINNHFYLDTLRFENDGIVYTNLIHAADKYVMMKSGTDLMLTGKDTLTAYNNLEPMSQSPAYFTTSDRIQIIDEALVTSTPGAYVYSYRFIDRFIINGTPGNAELTVPILFSVYRRAVGDSLYSMVHGRLDPGLKNSLKNGDTMILREYELRFQK